VFTQAGEKNPEALTQAALLPGEPALGTTPSPPWLAAVDLNSDRWLCLWASDAAQLWRDTGGWGHSCAPVSPGLL
jgi:hypothetical protein